MQASHGSDADLVVPGEFGAARLPPKALGFCAEQGLLIRALWLPVKEAEACTPIPVEVGGEELVAVAVDQREEGDCRMVAIAACSQ